MAACGSDSGSSGASSGSGGASSSSGGGTPSGDSQSKEMRKIDVIVASPFSLGQFYVLFLMGKEKGIYAEHGLDVNFFAGTGSATSAQVVASGKADFGIGVGATAVISTVAQGAKIKMVGADDPVATISVLSKAPDAIEKPADLKGKTIGVPPGTTQAQIWPGFLERNDISQSDVKTLNIPITTMQPSLAQGKVDGYLSYATSNLPILKSIGVKDPHAMLFSDYGMKVAPDEGIIATDQTISEDPQLVKDFVAAVEESLQYGVEHVSEAVDLGSQVDPKSFKKQVALEQSTIQAANIKDNSVSGKPYTYMSPQDWEDLVDIMKTYAKVSVKAPTEYYTNDFVPATTG
jgi:NitT/TauT family transport system substrate-binding protein